MENMDQLDGPLLERFQRAAFNYFLEQVNQENGLVADRSTKDAPASIAAVGLALSCYPVGVERGWLAREAAAKCILATLRFFWNSEQSEDAVATGHKGFFYHFLDMKTGKRVWQSELSMIDTALLLAGILVVSTTLTTRYPTRRKSAISPRHFTHALTGSGLSAGKRRFGKAGNPKADSCTMAGKVTLRRSFFMCWAWHRRRTP